MELSVIIVTLNRPDCLRRCLECLTAQEPRPAQIIVVDGSADELSEKVVNDFAGVEYLRNPRGYGHMTFSRNLGLSSAKGEIIAFLDDDAYARPGWSAELLKPYANPAVAAVGGRALNGQPGEETDGADQIGKLLPNGRLAAHFAADSGSAIEVDHIIGCNMSFRRSMLARLGGLRDEYPGTEVREETDICLRVKALGGKLIFAPGAVVDHVGAGQAKGKRFDLRYEYFAKRNHSYLMLRNFGVGSGIFWRSAVDTFWLMLKECGYKLGAAIARFGAAAAGLLAGIVAGAGKSQDPVRNDAEGRALADKLS